VKKGSVRILLIEPVKREREETPPGIKVLHVGGEFTQKLTTTQVKIVRRAYLKEVSDAISAHLLAPYILFTNASA
jgi:hypothetical protein